jgi:hypothetical protein
MKKGEAANGALDLTLGEIVELYDIGIGNLPRGHAGLNGFNKAVGERVMLQPFSLTDEVRQRITRNKFILRPFIDEVDKEERLRITQEVMDDPEALFVPQDDEARQAIWHKKYAEALKVKHTVHGLHIFKHEDFFRENHGKFSMAGSPRGKTGIERDTAGWRMIS